MAKAKETDAVETQVAPDMEALKKEIAELKAKVVAGEEAALERVCLAMDKDPSLVKKALEPKPVEPMIECEIRTPVRINGREYIGRVTVSHSTFGVLMQAVGDRHMRVLREMTGNQYVIDELSGGQMTPRLVKPLDPQSERLI